MADDPVAEFLAREKAELGDITTELGNGNSSDIGSTEDLTKTGGFVIEPKLPEQPKPDPVQTQDIPPAEGSLNGSSAHLAGEDSPSSGKDSPAPSAPSPMPTQSKKESPLMESWRVNFEADIKARDEKEEKRRIELEETAKKELETWYSHYRQQKANKSADNRSEAPKDASGKAYAGYSGPKPSVTDTGVWESVCGMCDLQGKNNRSEHDLTRMRGLLLNLKAPQTNLAS